MATIKDVANKAGVSIGAVSRAFNNYPDISEKTRERIFEIAKDLNYTPNIVAKSLSSKQQKTIGLIASGIFTSNEKDTNSFDTFKGVYTAVEENAYELSIFFIDSEKQHQKSYAQFCKDRKIGGAILQGIRTDDRYFEDLMNTKIPCVMLDVSVEMDNRLIGSVSIDNFSASRESATYLLERHHRDIVIIAGTKETDVNFERLRGTKAAFKAYDVELDDRDVLYADFSEQEAYTLAKEYLKTNRPTAFICFSDLMALGVMDAIKEMGLSIPDDISIIGFDGLLLSDYTRPRLTTVRQNFYEMGRQSALLLQKLMNRETVDKSVYVKHQFLERESVKSLPEKS